ncbi:MAG: hypothetical protein OQL19_16560 [Gammaproteobacteria bacterium]|nr:hypothetical protein [Gammaproteobacteria bacterium]
MTVQSLDVQCQHCHSKTQFKIGHDDNQETIEKAIDNLQGKTQIQVRSIIKKHTIDAAEYGFALFACPECKILYNPYSVKVEYDNIMLFQPFHKCSRCNTTLIKATEAIEAYACKQCGEKKLTSA